MEIKSMFEITPQAELTEVKFKRLPDADKKSERNRRVMVGMNDADPLDNSVHVRFMRLVSPEEVLEIEQNPTFSMNIKRNIVMTDLCISVQAAEDLIKLLKSNVEDYYFNYPKNVNELNAILEAKEIQ